MQIAPPTCNSLWIVADLFTDVHLLTLEKQVENIHLLLYLILKNIKNVKVNVMKKMLKWVKTWKSPSTVIHIWQYGSAL